MAVLEGETRDDVFNCCIFHCMYVRRTGVPLVVGSSLVFKFLLIINEHHLDRLY
jgi:hypothetical protein